jgi:hypothetical protein
MPGPSRPARPARCSAEARLILLHGEGVDAATGVVVRDAGRAAVDHGFHAFDGERGFGDVGADDDLWLLAGRDGGVLILRREFAMQRHDATAACKARP